MACTVQKLQNATMLGPEPTLPDIVLSCMGGTSGSPDAPRNDGSSSLSPDAVGVEVEVGLGLGPYRVRTACHGCDRTLRFIIVSTDGTRRCFEHLLLDDLHFLCPSCVGIFLNHNNGRRR